MMIIHETEDERWKAIYIKLDGIRDKLGWIALWLFFIMWAACDIAQGI